MSTPFDKAVELVSKSADCSDLHLEAIHSMDHVGHLQGRISWKGHVMEINNYHYDCGASGEAVRCSCGFKSDEYSGNGCWQCGHDGPPEDHKFDFKHEVIYASAYNYQKHLSLEE